MGFANPLSRPVCTSLSTWPVCIGYQRRGIMLALCVQRPTIVNGKRFELLLKLLQLKANRTSHGGTPIWIPSWCRAFSAALSSAWHDGQMLVSPLKPTSTMHFCTFSSMRRSQSFRLLGFSSTGSRRIFMNPLSVLLEQMCGALCSKLTFLSWMIFTFGPCAAVWSTSSSDGPVWNLANSALRVPLQGLASSAKPEPTHWCETLLAWNARNVLVNTGAWHRDRAEALPLSRALITLFIFMQVDVEQMTFTTTCNVTWTDVTMCGRDRYWSSRSTLQLMSDWWTFTLKPYGPSSSLPQEVGASLDFCLGHLARHGPMRAMRFCWMEMAIPRVVPVLFVAFIHAGDWKDYPYMSWNNQRGQ